MSDHSDDHAIAADDTEEFSDCGSGRITPDGAGKLDRGIRSGDRKHVADDLALAF
jgi:hypothetical protein